ncbi:MAG: SDR family NAD(P)-dependent oxidoreductase [Phycisphaeraceae bacterium]
MTHPQAPLAIVTGASGGIGACVARRLARRGYRLALLGRDTHRLANLQAELHAGPGCTTLALDLADPAPRRRALVNLLAEQGPAEVVVNNAGYNVYRRFVDTAADEHDAITQVNYHAAIELTRLALPAMLERRRGWVINVTSVSAKMGPWGHAAYAAAKAALVTTTQSLAAEHPRTGVHFTYVNPGIVDTAYYHGPAMGPLWQSVRRHAIPPDAVARRIETLLDRPRLELAVPRHYRILDWLTAFSPTLCHRLVASHSRPAEAPTTTAAEAPPAPAKAEG